MSMVTGLEPLSGAKVILACCCSSLVWSGVVTQMLTVSPAARTGLLSTEANSAVTTARMIERRITWEVLIVLAYMAGSFERKLGGRVSGLIRKDKSRERP